MIRFLMGIVVGLVLATGVIAGAVFLAPSYLSDPSRPQAVGSGILDMSVAVTKAKGGRGKLGQRPWASASPPEPLGTPSWGRPDWEWEIEQIWSKKAFVPSGDNTPVAIVLDRRVLARRAAVASLLGDIEASVSVPGNFAC